MPKELYVKVQIEWEAMYSPKIKPELIPRIYEIAKTKGTHMTTLVNDVLRKALNEMEGTEENKHSSNF